MQQDAIQLTQIASKLHELFALTLKAERRFHPELGGFPLLDKLMNDPEWQWLRPLSTLLADIDHALAQKEELTTHEHALAATHVRGLVFNAGEFIDEKFLEHYRPLLQLSPELASAHGELKALLKDSPLQPEDESARLHARHTWAMRLGHRPGSSQ
jgi:hypothetical protein